ncbi:MAG TPA: acyl-CoA dehydrogenase family protein [Dongiaceae bacterium]|jgi:alkylation response protein AidB-like acyl-CoA dehydrogenase|nr:acyl-CoA dehydrogenase family protein [Dongiaceae bacterium]
MAANFFDADRDLQKALARNLGPTFAEWRPMLSDFGAWVATDVDAAAAYTDRQAPPVLAAYAPDGRIENRILQNPGWRAVSREAYRRGVVGLNYGKTPAPFLLTFALGYLLSQADVSLHCPVTMTGAVAYVLSRHGPAAVRDRYLPMLTRRDGEALTGGTWATELHGGSDIGGTTTVARPVGDHWRLSGLKWFASNANGGLALATARPEGAGPGTKGLGLYLVPLTLPDGTANALRFRRLKDKLGTTGIPTAEIDLLDAWAAEVAPPPEGFRLMMAALEFSRIHNAMGSAGLQRRAFAEAHAYAAERRAFGEAILHFPMIQEQLAVMRANLAAGLGLALEAARAFDAADQAHAAEDDAHRLWLRIATALAKYQAAEEANRACRAAIEIIGGNGYTYDHVTPRLLRDAQVMTVWEGPANIQALELLRLVIGRHPGAAVFKARIEALLGDLPPKLEEIASSVRQALADAAAIVVRLASDAASAQRHALRLLGLMADILAAALLLEDAAQELAAGEDRKSLIARLFVETHFTAAPRGALPDRDWLYRRFGEFVG